MLALVTTRWHLWHFVREWHIDLPDHHRDSPHHFFEDYLHWWLANKEGWHVMKSWWLSWWYKYRCLSALEPRWTRALRCSFNTTFSCYSGAARNYLTSGMPQTSRRTQKFRVFKGLSIIAFRYFNCRGYSRWGPRSSGVCRWFDWQLFLRQPGSAQGLAEFFVWKAIKYVGRFARIPLVVWGAALDHWVE